MHSRRGGRKEDVPMGFESVPSRRGRVSTGKKECSSLSRAAVPVGAEGASAQRKAVVRAVLALLTGKAEQHQGPGGQMLPVLALLQEKGLQGTDCVYVTKEGKCISGEMLACKNS